MDRTHLIESTECLAARPNRQAPRTRVSLLGVLVLALLAMGLLAGCLAEEGAPAGDGSGLSFATDIQPLLNAAGCYACHGVTPLTTTTCSLGCHLGLDYTATTITALTAGDMVGLASYTATGDIVSAGSSANSTFWQVVSGDSTYTTNGGAMINSMGIGNLSGSDKSTIQSWINGGANP